MPLQEYLNSLGGQTAEPQRVAAVQSIQHALGVVTDEVSPILATKTQRKYYLGSRSPSGQSPVTKSRKTPQNVNLSSSASTNPMAYTSKEKDSSDKETGSPKQKSWKNFVAQQFKKIQSTNDPNVTPESGSIGIPLALCPPVR